MLPKDPLVEPAAHGIFSGIATTQPICSRSNVTTARPHPIIRYLDKAAITHGTASTSLITSSPPATRFNVLIFARIQPDLATAGSRVFGHNYGDPDAARLRIRQL